MSRRPARCTKADIRRALEAVEEAGMPMAVEILPDGTIRISPPAEKAKEPARVGQRPVIVL